ncbi:altronate dehydratase family protein [Anaerolentibacter hominis]|uniref:UxaA family hydrolase n=1 Tax=Anaerolentibacter hominis TaxID=3079009 RepID=UPI0031B8A7B6
MEKKKLIQIMPEDSVAVALEDFPAGEVLELNGETVTLTDPLPFGHKVALKDLQEGDNIIKYGHPIGHALCDIKKGNHIHTHNLKTNLEGVLNYSYGGGFKRESGQPAGAKFDGYVRPDGRVGIRNELWIIPTVGCVNTTAKILEKQAGEALGDKVDGVCAYTHPYGCSQMGDDLTTTRILLKGLIENPNAGGVLILSLGCENNNLETFLPFLGDYDKNRVKFLVTQEAENEYEEGMELLRSLADYAAGFHREPVDASKLVIGFKCGGSDAFSGITANALCGRINDKLTAYGGTTILTEVPEMFGAETILMDRAVDKEVFEKEVGLINNFKQYFMDHHQTIYENPSPGNKKGGISTLEEKSLGCIQKGGKAPVVDVLALGEQAVKNGLNLLTGPGNDLVSCTNLAASGAQIILFTTGRGNPYGGAVPTVKISSNSRLYERKKHWIDYNAGVILEGKDFEEAADELFEYLLKLASGKVHTRNEEYGYKEIALFKNGVTL